MSFSFSTVADRAITAAQYPDHMTHAFARALSIVGHPILALPASVLTLMLWRGEAQQAWSMAWGFAILALVVMGYSAWQVRRGQWAHVDASHQGERRTLNRFLLMVLVAGALLSVWSGASRELSLALALSAAMLLLALLTQRWCKLSLHVAFALFAALLLALAGTWPLLVGLAFALLVAWSRLHLQRHAPRDVVAGAAAGLMAGLLFLLAFGSVGG